MKTALAFATAVAACIRPAVPATVTIYSGHQQPEVLVRPALAVLMESMSARGLLLSQGELVLLYLSDADAEDSATAASALDEAEDRLLSADGIAALRQSLYPASIILMRLSPASSSSSEDGPRTRTHEKRLTAWLQTGLP